MWTVTFRYISLSRVFNSETAANQTLKLIYIWILPLPAIKLNLIHIAFLQDGQIHCFQTKFEEGDHWELLVPQRCLEGAAQRKHEQKGSEIQH